MDPELEHYLYQDDPQNPVYDDFGNLIGFDCDVCDGKGEVVDECNCYSFLDTMSHEHGEPRECEECEGQGRFRIIASDYPEVWPRMD